METDAFVEALEYARNQAHPAPQPAGIRAWPTEATPCTPDGCVI